MNNKIVKVKISSIPEGYTMTSIKESLNKEELESFEEFMKGQTMAIAPDGEVIVYYNDFDRWYYYYKPVTHNNIK